MPGSDPLQSRSAISDEAPSEERVRDRTDGARLVVSHALVPIVLAPLCVGPPETRVVVAQEDQSRVHFSLVR